MFLLLARGSWALTGARVTCGSGAIQVLLRLCSLTALRAVLYLPPLQAARVAQARSAFDGCVSWPEHRGIRAVAQCFRYSVEPIAAAPTSPFMALPIDPLAVRAQALLPRGSSVCGCAVFLSLVCCFAVPEFFQRDRVSGKHISCQCFCRLRILCGRKAT